MAIRTNIRTTPAPALHEGALATGIAPQDGLRGPWSNTDRVTLHELYRAGTPIPDIAPRLARNLGDILAQLETEFAGNHLTRRPLRAATEMTDSDMQLIRGMHAQNYLLIDIQRATDLTSTAIRDELRRVATAAQLATQAIPAEPEHTRTQAPKSDKPVNHGKPWDDTQDAELNSLFDMDMRIDTIARCMGRTSRAIAARLLDLKRVMYIDETRRLYKAIDWCDMPLRD